MNPREILTKGSLGVCVEEEDTGVFGPLLKGKSQSELSFTYGSEVQHKVRKTGNEALHNAPVFLRTDTSKAINSEASLDIGILSYEIIQNSL